VPAVAGRADAAALAGECHDESLAAAGAPGAGEAEAEQPALEIAAELLLDVSRHGPLGSLRAARCPGDKVAPQAAGSQPAPPMVVTDFRPAIPPSDSAGCLTHGPSALTSRLKAEILYS